MTTCHEDRATPPVDPVPGWNDTATTYERDTTIDRVVSLRARERPDAVAIDGPGGAMTYEELARRSDAVARSLAPFVVEADQCIGVLSGRCAEAVVAFLGVMKAGAAYVPLELDQPAPRLSFMVADTRARVVLAPTHLAHAAQALGDVTVLAIAPAAETSGAAPVGHGAGPRSLANVMYTSGSTGRPKGVAVEHRGVLRYVRGGRDLVPRPGYRVLHVGQLGFDAATYEMWAALCNGATLVIHPEGRFDPVAVARTITDFRVTMGMFTAGQLHLMVDGALASLASYRILISAGDVLSAGHAARLRSAHPAVRLFNAYGPTEATITASLYEVRDVTPGRSVPIGRPLANTTLYVIGEDGPCAPGEVGELYVGGDGVARGYLGLAELTAERFVPDVFGAPGGRLYRTGDLVRLNSDAELEFLGRRDDQVKIRGYLVEPAEVAAVLNGHPGVDEVEVVVRESSAGVRQLIAFVTTNYDVDAARLRRYARRRLPEYMVPSRVIVVAEMPRTAVGKNDRKALLELGGSVAPRSALTPLESIVAEAWRRVLETDDVLAEDDFFESGGDSLLALHLVTEIEHATGTALDLACVFEERTLARLARRVARLRAVPSGRPAARLPELVVGAPTTGRASLTQAQACFLSELAADALPYQANAVLHFDGPLDTEVLRRALESVVRRHEILRTSLPKVLGARVLRVHDDVSLRLDEVDLRTEPDPDAAFAALCAERFARRIDLEVAPLVAWTVARVGEQRWSLVQVEHHAVHDGWSFATLVGEIAASYRSLAAGQEPVAVPGAATYSDFAEWQNDFVATDEGRRQADYWRGVLEGLPAPPALATDRAHPLRRSYRGSSLRRPLRVDLVDRVHRAASRAGTTPYVVMLTTFLLLLARLSGDDEVVVGSGLANRRLEGTEGILGMFVNTVVVRADLGGGPSIHDALRTVSRVMAAAQDNQELPFEEVVRVVDPARRPGHHPFYDHLFSFHDTPFPSLELDGLDLRVFDTLSNGSAKADLNVVVVNDRGRDSGAGVSDGELTVVWEYSSDVFDEDTAEVMLNAYVTLLDHLAGDVERPLDDLEMTTGDERAARVVQPRSPYERDATVDQVFAQRVGEDPDAVALSAGDVDVSYRELDASVGRFARRLATLGVAPGERVGVVDDRGVAMVVALLGVLRAGAVYVGLDPATPPARRERMVRDAQVGVVCVSAASAQLVRDWGLDVVEVDERGLGATRIATSRRPVAASPSHAAGDPAYVSFTSGSTGEPKGVVVTHRGVVRLVRGTNYVDLGPGDVVLAAAPLAFDASTFEILGALISGSRVVLARSGPWSARELSDLITASGVSTAYFSAGLFHQLVDYAPEAFANLRQVLAGGDVLSPTHVNRLLVGRTPQFCLVNGYGPTEGTTFSYCHRLHGGDRVEGPVPIGRPIANTSGVVVDSRGHLVPDGLAGELWIGGDGVALGYVGRPDLTAERFIDNPFGGDLGDRLYRTGDRVRSRHGLTGFLGRVDRQVKIRGFRVEPSEVEAALVALPDVAQAYVAGIRTGRDDTRLTAYLVAPAGVAHGSVAPASDDADRARRDALSATLPTFMIPSAYVWVDELPLNRNGKVDASRLPEPPSSWFLVDPSDPSAPLEAFVARRVEGASATEQTLIALWQEVLGVRVIELDDDFFDLGGHSLLAVELLAAIERTFGVQLPLAAVFSSPTVVEMARLLGKHRSAVPDSLVALTTTGERVPIFAVTAGDGNVVGFGPLARRLGPEQPFYALQPHGLDSSAPPHRSVEAMASHYVREVQRVQPRGPYVLAGRCFGSFVAYEMARQLESRGERVAVLASIDSGGPMWRERHLANGVLYDPMMNEARVRAADEGLVFADPFADVAAAERFTGWLQEPWVNVDGIDLSRYVGAAYRARPDVLAALPLHGQAYARAILAWAWVSGPREMGMQRSLLVDPGDTGADRGTAAARARAVARRALGRAGDWLNAATFGWIPALSRRRRARVLALAADNVARYRAGPLNAPVVLLHASGEHFAHQRLEFAKWYGLDVARIEEREVEATHHGVLREPGVGALAETLRHCVDEALADVASG